MGGGTKLVIGDGSTVFNDLPYVTLQDEDVLTVPDVVGLGTVPQSTDAGITWTRNLSGLGNVSVSNLSINNQNVDDFPIISTVYDANVDDSLWYCRLWNSGFAEAHLLGSVQLSGGTPTALMGGYYSTAHMHLPNNIFSNKDYNLIKGHGMARLGTGFGVVMYFVPYNTTFARLDVWGNQSSSDITLLSMSLYCYD